MRIQKQIVREKTAFASSAASMQNNFNNTEHHHKC